MQWTVHGERQIYNNPWVNLCSWTSSSLTAGGGNTMWSGCGTWP